jgi:prophage DNA circulation protein
MGRLDSFKRQLSKRDPSDIVIKGRMIAELLKNELIIDAEIALDNVYKLIEKSREEYRNGSFTKAKGKGIETLEKRVKKLRTMAEILDEVVGELENRVNKLGEKRGLVDRFKKAFSGINTINNELKAKIKREPTQIKTNSSLDRQASKSDLSDIIIKGRMLEELLKNELILDAELALKNVGRLIEANGNSNRYFRIAKREYREYTEELGKWVQKLRTTVELYSNAVDDLENKVRELGNNKEHGIGIVASDKRTNLKALFDGIKGNKRSGQEISVAISRGKSFPSRDVL